MKTLLIVFFQDSARLDTTKLTGCLYFNPFCIDNGVIDLTSHFVKNISIIELKQIQKVNLLRYQMIQFGHAG